MYAPTLLQLPCMLMFNTTKCYSLKGDVQQAGTRNITRIIIICAMAATAFSFVTLGNAEVTFLSCGRSCGRELAHSFVCHRGILKVTASTQTFHVLWYWHISRISHAMRGTSWGRLWFSLSQSNEFYKYYPKRILQSYRCLCWVAGAHALTFALMFRRCHHLPHERW